MSGKITHFRVGNGDMTLVVLTDNTTILIDCCLCNTEELHGRDGREALLARLPRDPWGRPYVDVMVLTHPDKDHCRGLVDEFHLGPMSAYDNKAKKIIIREMWSSPLIFRRRSADHPLCPDAIAWNTEAKRRVNWFKANKRSAAEGDRILILGGDEPGHTQGAEELVIPADAIFNRIGGVDNRFASMRLLGPLPAEELDEESLDKNDSSISIQMTLLFSADDKQGTLLLFGGDAAVGIWRKLWEKYKATEHELAYDLLLAPHHCSWSVISGELYDGGRGTPDAAALNALGVIHDGGVIVSSSVEIKNDDNDPPCYGAKLEYVKITNRAGGDFICTGEADDPIEYLLTKGGLQRVERVRAPLKKASATAIVSTPAQHG